MPLQKLPVEASAWTHGGVALVGVSGAMNYWAPLQPILGVVSVGLISGALVVRLRGAVACPR